MLARLLARWEGKGENGAGLRLANARLEEDVKHAALGDPARFLEALDAVASGRSTCAAAGMAADSCYDGGDSFTITDTFDALLLRLGRALGFDTLFFTATFARPRRNQTTRVSAGELVDLRLTGDIRPTHCPAPPLPDRRSYDCCH